MVDEFEKIDKAAEIILRGIPPEFRRGELLTNIQQSAASIVKLMEEYHEKDQVME